MVEALDRESFVRSRRVGIGGTDVAPILGLSPWSSPIDVWLQKMGEAPPKEPTEAMWWGTEMEALIAKRYAERTGLPVITPPTRFYQHRSIPYFIAAPDRLIDDEGIGLECKTATGFSIMDWGRDGTDVVPDQYALQCHHYMNVLDFDRWDIAALIGGNDFRIYHLFRDRELEAGITERLTAWWEKHIIGGERPAITAGAGVRAWIHSKFPADRGTMIPAGSLANEWARRYREAKAAYKHAETDMQEAEHNLKVLIADDQGIQGEGWRATWKLTKDSHRVDWEKAALIALGHLPKETAEQIRAEAEDVRPGSRRFLFMEKGEK